AREGLGGGGRPVAARRRCPEARQPERGKVERRWDAPKHTSFGSSVWLPSRAVRDRVWSSDARPAPLHRDVTAPRYRGTVKTVMTHTHGGHYVRAPARIHPYGQACGSAGPPRRGTRLRPDTDGPATPTPTPNHDVARPPAARNGVRRLAVLRDQRATRRAAARRPARHGGAAHR